MTTKAQLTLNFVGNGSSSGGAKYSIEASQRKPPDDGSQYFRVHGKPDHLTISSGTINLSNRNLSRLVEQFLVFQGTVAMDLSYSGATGVTFTQIGNLIFKDPNPGVAGDTAVVHYDGARGQLVANIPIYGVFKLVYQAPYDLYLAHFSGSCPSVSSSDPPRDVTSAGADDDELTHERDPMLILAWNATDEVVASNTLTPPPCSSRTRTTPGPGGAWASMGAKLPKLKIELDPQYPPKLASSTASALGAKCRIRVFPAGSGASLEMTSGSIGQNFGRKIVPIKDALVYSGSSSATLSYPPTGGINAVARGNFVDVYGKSFSPSVVPPGGSIVAVNWLSSNTYTNPEDRVTNYDEVAIGDVSRRAIGCYGVVMCSYSTECDIYEVIFDYVPTLKAFNDIHLVARVGDTIVGMLKIDSPVMRGVK